MHHFARPRRARASSASVLAVLAAVVVGACSDKNSTSPSTSSKPCGSGTTVTLTALNGTTVPCATGTTFSLAGGAKYLIVPNLASGQPTSGVTNTATSYKLTVGGSAAAMVLPPEPDQPFFSLQPPILGGMDGARSAGLPGARQLMFDAALRERSRRAMSSGEWTLAPQASKARGLSLSVTRAGDPALGSIRTFKTLTSFSSTSSSYTSVDAKLAFIGTHIYLYIDTLAPANGFSNAQLTAFGNYFDQTLYQIDIDAFGPPADIDANGHVIMLMTPKVNALTPSSQCASSGYVAGYFDGVDFSTSTNSNQGEVFYSIVPDPTGSASCAHNLTDVDLNVPGVFLHELEHLINYSQHVVVHKGQQEFGWLDEGMAIVAEELGSRYYENKFPPPTGRQTPTQIFPDSSQGFVQNFLYDSYFYMLKPDTVTVTLHSDADLGFQWRGGDWTLVRWLADQKTDAVLKTMAQSNSVGTANIAASAGESFGALFGDFTMALWADSIPGLAKSSVPSRYRFITSPTVQRSLRRLYQRVYDNANGNASYPRPFPILPTALATSGSVSGTLVPGSMAYYTLDLTGTSAATTITFSTPSGTALASNLGPQISVYRLP